MFFLLKSERWTPYRDFCFAVYGSQTTTFVFGLLTVLVVPILFWILRRCENVIQSTFGIRKLATLPSTAEVNGEDPDANLVQFVESVLSIHKDCQTEWMPVNRVRAKLKVFSGLVLSKMVFIGSILCLLMGMDRIQSTGFMCRKLKVGTDFLMRNDTKPAETLEMSFEEIFELKKLTAEHSIWISDRANGLLAGFEILGSHYLK